MKKLIKRALMFLLLAVVSLPGLAQDKTSYSDWTAKMLKQKHEYIVEYTKMTKEQKSKFMPVYEQMEQEIYQLNVQTRSDVEKIAKNKNSNDDDYAQAASMIAGVKQKEGEIELRYHEKFAQILSSKQLFLLKRAEKKFTRDMLKKNKKK